MTCLFCASARPGTKEHVTPQWLLEHLGLPLNDQFFQGNADTVSGAIVEQRIHSSFSFVQGRVCGECNNGWMSRLECAARPLLTPLIENARDLASVPDDDAKVIGKWAAKTASLVTWTGIGLTRVPSGHLRALYGDHGDDGAPAPGVEIFAAQGGYLHPSGYTSGQFWPHISAGAQREDPPTPTSSACSSAISTWLWPPGPRTTPRWSARSFCTRASSRAAALTRPTRVTFRCPRRNRPRLHRCLTS